MTPIVGKRIVGFGGDGKINYGDFCMVICKEDLVVLWSENHCVSEKGLFSEHTKIILAVVGQG